MSRHHEDIPPPVVSCGESTAAPPTGLKQPEGQTAAATEEGGLTPPDVRHNLAVVVMLDAIFTMGAADFVIALQPLLVHLKASNTLIGLVTGASFMTVPGLILSPWISQRFRVKKWYLFIAHLPYLGMFLLIGLALIFSGRLELSDRTLLALVVGLMLANWFFGGFVSLPHQEYIAACVPMSHRGRMTGFSTCIGGGLSIVSAAIGGYVLLKVSKPMAFGYLFLMTWLICQSGYLLALFGRERPVPVEKAPKPWSREMLAALWEDKAYIRVIVVVFLNFVLQYPAIAFVNIYGFRTLGMIAATAAIIQVITQVFRVGPSPVIGLLTDRLGAKRVYPYCSLFLAAAVLMPLLVANQYGVYISVALSTIYMTLFYAASYPLIFGVPKPEHRSGHFTVQLLTGFIAMALGPILMGRAIDAFSYRPVFVVVLVLALLSFPFARWMFSVLSDDPKAYS